MVLGDFQGRGVLHIWIIVEQGLTVFAVGAGVFFGASFFFSLSLSFLSYLFYFSFMWETARYRLKYCTLNPRQPANQLSIFPVSKMF